MVLTPAQLEHIRQDAAARVESVAALTQRICAVPAPTGQEQARADFVAALWRERGYTPEIDAVSNVYVRRGHHPGAPLLMLLAHIDTVFPAETPLTIRRDGDYLYGPGIGDNCSSVATMISALDMLDAYQWETPVDILAVADVGEEGLGNLRGARTAVERYREQLGGVIAIDGNVGVIVNAAVGSQRWRITVSGPGGHSFGSFGTPSAIHGLGTIIAALTTLQVPRDPRTTYNVGMIEGGTSVNTIAARASALLDLRSTDPKALNTLAQQVRALIDQHTPDGLRVEIEVLGERPAGEGLANDPLLELARQALQWTGIEPRYAASSTDINIPISMGIPAVCIGATHGGKAHTTEEFIRIAPFAQGLAHVTRLCMDATALFAQQAKA